MSILFLDMTRGVGTDLGIRLSQALNAEYGNIESRHFPDGELYQRVLSEVAGRDVIIFTNLFNPDIQLFELLSLGHTLKEIGAKQRILVCPYLPYMRQDIRFHPGESVTSRHFAKHLSLAFDKLITVDPHLHRYNSLNEIYSLESLVVSAQSAITQYLNSLPQTLLLIGPDEESEQWVAAIAKAAQLPYQILVKQRSGDYEVEVSQPKLAPYRDHRPVLVDDIISSGRTMLSTLEHLALAGMPQPLVIGVHGIFADDAFELLTQHAEVLTCNSIPHVSNHIDLLETLTDACTQIR